MDFLRWSGLPPLRVFNLKTAELAQDAWTHSLCFAKDTLRTSILYAFTYYSSPF